MQEFEVAPLNFMIFTILHSASHSLHWDASTRHYAPILTWLQQSSSPDMLDWCLMSRCQLFATVSCRYVCIHKNMKQNFIVKVSISKWSLKLTELSKEAQFTRQLREGFKNLVWNVNICKEIYFTLFDNPPFYYLSQENNIPFRFSSEKVLEVVIKEKNIIF